jgi:hypothetical protein
LKLLLLIFNFCIFELVHLQNFFYNHSLLNLAVHFTALPFDKLRVNSLRTGSSAEGAEVVFALFAPDSYRDCGCIFYRKGAEVAKGFLCALCDLAVHFTAEGAEFL